MATRINRDTGLTPKLFHVDAQVFIFFMIWFFHWRMWTFVLFVVVTLFFWALERRGITIKAFFRAVKWALAGIKRELHLREGEWH